LSTALAFRRLNTLLNKRELSQADAFVGDFRLRCAALPPLSPPVKPSTPPDTRPLTRSRWMKILESGRPVNDLAHTLCLPPGDLKAKVAELLEERFAKTSEGKTIRKNSLPLSGRFGSLRYPMEVGLDSRIAENQNEVKNANMTVQVCLLQSHTPFETFAIEPANGRVLQIRYGHSVATTEGTRPGEAVISVRHTSGAFEVINASHVTSVSVPSERWCLLGSVHVRIESKCASTRNSSIRS
jgi:hypothetical protein